MELLEDRPLPSLVAAFDFGESNGMTVLDTSESGNNRTISGATRISAWKDGGALSFNGTSNRVTVPHSTSLRLTAGRTLETWVKPTAASTSWATALLKERPDLLP